MQVSIIIINYKTRDFLDKCLASVMKQRGPGYEVIVVDNDSQDGSVEMVTEQYPEVILIASSKNLGFAGGNNLAYQRAGGKYILLLNPDAEMSDNTLPVMYDFMEKQPHVTAAGCKVLYADGKIQMSCGSLPTISSAIFGGEIINMLFKKIFKKSSFIGACGITEKDLIYQQEVENLLGAFVILRKDFLDKHGFFDDNMFMFFEECELFYRIKKNGGTIMYTPETEIVHFAGASTTLTNIKTSVKNYQQSQEYYFKKVFQIKKYFFIRLALITSALLKSVLLYMKYTLTSKKHKDIRTKKKFLWHWNISLYNIKKLFLVQK